MIGKSFLFKSQLFHTSADTSFAGSHKAHGCKISFCIRKKYGNAAITEGLCQYTQAHGFSGTGCTCNQSVAVCHLRIDIDLFLS